MQSPSPLNFIMLPSRVFILRIFVICGILLLMVSIVRREIFDPNPALRGSLVIVDTSLSMSVEDIVGPTRIQISRLDTVREMLTSLDSIRPRGIMTFADNARLQLPLSSDSRLWKETLSTLAPVRYGAPTDIESAIASAVLIYSGTPIDIVLFTDGESTQTSSTGTILALPGDMSLTLIGIGTKAGGKILANYDANGRIVYKKYNGEEIVSRLDEDNITRLANIYDASVYFVRDTTDMYAISQIIFPTIGTSDESPRYDTFILLATLLLLVGLIMRDHRLK